MKIRGGSLTLDALFWRVAVLLLVLAFVLPLSFFPASGGAGRDRVYAWEIVQRNPIPGLALFAPLFSLMVLHRRERRPRSKVALALVPPALAASAFVLFLESALSFSVTELPIPFVSLPILWTGSTVAAGCWAFVAANGLLLIVWGAAVFRSRGATFLSIDKARRWV